MRLDEHWPRWSWGLLAAVAVFLFHLIPLISSSFAPGWDSYFYLVQAKSYLEEGSMHSSRISLFYPLLIGFSWVLHDYILAYKILVALSASLIATAVVVRCLTFRSHFLVPLALILWFCLSPHFHYFCAQFCKNALGLFFFLCMTLSLANRKWFWAIVCCVLSLFTHKLTGILSMIGVLVFLLFHIPRRIRWALISLPLLGILILFALPKEVFSWDDLSRQHQFLQATLSWSPWHFSKAFREVISPFWHLEIWLTAAGILVLPFLSKPIAMNGEKFTCLVIAMICLCPFLVWEKNGFAFRLLIIIPPILIFYLAGWFHYHKITGFILIVCLTINSLLGYIPFQGTSFDPDYRGYSFVNRKLLKALPHHFDGLVIAHRGLAEFITFSNGIDVMPWRADYQVNDKQYYRVAYLEGHLKGLAQHTTARRLSMNYYLIYESEWQKLLAKRSPEERHELTGWKNPSEVRPAYFQKYKAKAH